jgi:hypothetical protein
MNNLFKIQNQQIVDRVPTVALLDLPNHESWTLGRFHKFRVPCTQNQTQALSWSNIETNLLESEFLDSLAQLI